MKRLHSEIDKELTIHKPRFLPCDVCNKKVYSYHLCTSPYVYCSLDCVAILILSEQNRMLHEKENTFDKKE